MNRGTRTEAKGSPPEADDPPAQRIKFLLISTFLLILIHFYMPSPQHISHKKLLTWVEDLSKHCQPDAIHWCDGSEEEYRRLCSKLVASRTFIKLNEGKRPNSFLSRSDPSDVARVEDR